MHHATVPPATSRLRRRIAHTVLLASAAIAPAACATGRAAELADFPAIEREAPAGGVTSHVVLVSIDGLRPDAIEAFGAGTLQRLMREGSYTLSATTILPSKTLPSHTSMLTGEDVDEHGIA